MGLFLIVLGSTFVWYLLASWKRAKAMDDWVAVPSEIITSEVQQWQYNAISAVEYIPMVEYTFTFEGKEYVSDQIRRVPIRSALREKIEPWIEKYGVGERPTAYVNPQEPEVAVLKRESKAAIYTVWFPMLFVVGGLGMILSGLMPSLRLQELLVRRKKG